MRSSPIQIFLLFIIPFFLKAQDKTYDFLFYNGKIIDGTGNSWYYGDLAVKDGKIAAIGKLLPSQAKKAIDVKGRIIAPGFIDVHTHIEGDEVKSPEAANFIYDGVTTVITGNCGSSNLPVSEYLHMLDSLQLSVNVATLVGHGSIREMVMGRTIQRPSKDKLDEMVHLVEAAMQEGAFGLSTGLIYVPGTYAQTDEIIQLAAVANRFGGLYVSHIRDEADSVVQAVEEAIQIGRVNQMPIQISHYKISGQNNWGRSAETLPLLERARKEGIDVTIDQYPYTASSTVLNTLLPDKLLADGKDSLTERLKNPIIREHTIQFLLTRLKKRKLRHFSYTVIANYPADTTLNGLSIEHANLKLGRKHTAVQEAETILDMVGKGGAAMIFHGMSEQDVQAIMKYPFNMIASDATIRIPGLGHPHPRGYGTNARVLSKYVREEKIISIEEAVRRMTSLPAQKFRLKNRGLLLPGMVADLIVFDSEKIKDRSSFEQPHQYSEGMEYVLVNGKLVVDQGRHTGIRSGMVLYGPGYLKK